MVGLDDPEGLSHLDDSVISPFNAVGTGLDPESSRGARKLRWHLSPSGFHGAKRCKGMGFPGTAWLSGNLWSPCASAYTSSRQSHCCFKDKQHYFGWEMVKDRGKNCLHYPNPGALARRIQSLGTTASRWSSAPTHVPKDWSRCRKWCWQEGSTLALSAALWSCCRHRVMPLHWHTMLRATCSVQQETEQPCSYPREEWAPICSPSDGWGKGVLSAAQELGVRMQPAGQLEARLVLHLLLIELMLDGSLERGLWVLMPHHRCSGAAVRGRPPKGRKANHAGVYAPGRKKMVGFSHPKRLTTVEEKMG